MYNCIAAFGQKNSIPKELISQNFG